MNKCQAIMIFGDDHGDNECTFRCELEEDHKGSHRESGSMRSTFPYTLQWNEDMREQCDVCGARMMEKDEYLCDVCHQTLCPTCAVIKSDNEYGAQLEARCATHKDTKIEEGLFVCLKGCWRGTFEEAAQHPVDDLPNPEDHGLFCPKCGAGVTPDEPVE
jgi:hypothetical protein